MGLTLVTKLHRKPQMLENNYGLQAVGPETNGMCDDPTFPGPTYRDSKNLVPQGEPATGYGFMRLR